MAEDSYFKRAVSLPFKELMRQVPGDLDVQVGLDILESERSSSGDKPRAIVSVTIPYLEELKARINTIRNLPGMVKSIEYVDEHVIFPGDSTFPSAPLRNLPSICLAPDVCEISFRSGTVVGSAPAQDCPPSSVTGEFRFSTFCEMTIRAFISQRDRSLRDRVEQSSVGNGAAPSTFPSP